MSKPRSLHEVPRRKALTTIAAAAVSGPVAAQQPADKQQKPIEHKHEGMVNITAPPVYKRKFFTQEEFETVAVLADLIIPRTATPGARDARVQEIIDSAVRPSARAAWREGLKPFVTLDNKAQAALFERISKEKNTAGGRFFKLIKDATIDAYYSTREGLVTELGWNFNTYLPEFKGCTHPEHQV